MSTERHPTQADFSLDGGGEFDAEQFLVNVGFPAAGADRALDLINRPESFEAACADCRSPDEARERIARIMGALGYRSADPGSVTIGAGRKVGRVDAKTLCVVRLGDSIFNIGSGMSGNYSISCLCRDVRAPSDNERLRFAAESAPGRVLASMTAVGAGARAALDEMSRSEQTMHGDETIGGGTSTSRKLFDTLFRRKKP